LITQPFEYHAPATLEAVCQLLAAGDDGMAILGGGTMLVPEMGHGRVVPNSVVDLSRAGLAGLRVTGDEVVVGAMTTYADVLASAPARADAPLLTQVAGGVTGGPQIRNRGTVGGAASFANPASDVPTCLVALGARMWLASATGTREIAAEQFYLDAFRTARRADEVLARMVLPAHPGAGHGYAKFKTCESSWPIVTAACLASPDGSLRVALGGASTTPLIIVVDSPQHGVADLDWRDHVGEALDDVLDHPWTDVLASASYRRRIAPAIVARAVSRALDQRRQQESQ
jgi:aerobic carbon-monoxide dehydrogenase medium subunit